MNIEQLRMEMITARQNNIVDQAQKTLDLITKIFLKYTGPLTSELSRCQMGLIVSLTRTRSYLKDPAFPQRIQTARSVEELQDVTSSTREVIHKVTTEMANETKKRVLKILQGLMTLAPSPKVKKYTLTVIDAIYSHKCSCISEDTLASMEKHIQTSGNPRDTVSAILDHNIQMYCVLKEKAPELAQVYMENNAEWSSDWAMLGSVCIDLDTARAIRKAYTGLDMIQGYALLANELMSKTLDEVKESIEVHLKKIQRFQEASSDFKLKPFDYPAFSLGIIREILTEDTGIPNALNAIHKFYREAECTEQGKQLLKTITEGSNQTGLPYIMLVREKQPQPSEKKAPMTSNYEIAQKKRISLKNIIDVSDSECPAVTPENTNAALHIINALYNLKIYAMRADPKNTIIKDLTNLSVKLHSNPKFRSRPTYKALSSKFNMILEGSYYFSEKTDLYKEFEAIYQQMTELVNEIEPDIKALKDKAKPIMNQLVSELMDVFESGVTDAKVSLTVEDMRTIQKYRKALKAERTKNASAPQLKEDPPKEHKPSWRDLFNANPERFITKPLVWNEGIWQASLVEIRYDEATGKVELVSTPRK